MKVARKMLCALFVVTILCAMFATTAFAAEDGSLWMNNVANTQQNTTSVVVYADTVVSNGMVELRYDSSKLTYSSVTVSEQYVGTVAVNADTAGVVKIAWVAPGPYETNGADVALITVEFTGKSDNDVSVSGKVYDADGDLVTVVSAPEVGPDDGNADTGDAIRPAMVLMVLSATAAVVCLTKKGWWAK